MYVAFSAIDCRPDFTVTGVEIPAEHLVAVKLTIDDPLSVWIRDKWTDPWRHFKDVNV